MSKIYNLLAVLALFSCSTGFAQYENIWIFGDNAGLDFSGAAPVAITNPHTFSEACANICDTNGDLLFSTNGNIVWDRNHITMPNGGALISDFTYGTLGPTSSTSQGALIVPMPDSAGKYYIFSLTSIEMGGNYGRLYYSVVNMALNGGLGDVEPGRKGILLDSGNTELMTAVAGDRCNIWLVVTAHQPATWQFKSFEISAAGIGSVPVLSDFPIPAIPSANAGVMDISPDGKKLALSWLVPFSSAGRSELYDFSTATGVVSGQTTLTTTGGYGVCFSPDNTRLYTLYGALSQYDLTLSSPAAIIASGTSLGTGSIGMMRRAPDGSIYFPGQSSLSRIRYPNLAGAACMYAPNSVPLAAGSSPTSSLPHLVPVIRRDTVHTSNTVKPPCFTTLLPLYALNTSTGWDYRWNNGNAGSSGTADAPGTYWVSYHEPPCTYHTDTFHVVFESQLPALLPAAGCRNDSNARVIAVPVAGDTITYTYTWKNNVNQVIRGPIQSNQGDILSHINSSTLYILEVRAPNGCDTSLTVTVPEPVYDVSFTVSDSIICMGDSISFQNTSQGGITGHAWTFGDGGTSIQENPQHTYLQAGVYQVRLTGHTSLPCHDTSYRTIVVDSLLPAVFITSRDSICTGESILFTPRTDYTTLGLYWQTGDGSFLTTPNESIQHAYDRAGTMPVQLNARFRACPDAAFTDTVYVYPLPFVDLGPDTGLCLNGAPLFLRNLQPAPTGSYNVLWNTGDTTETIKVAHPGTFSFTISTAPLGCSTTETVTVHKDCYIDIPNAFTPNGDGVNDYFFPRQLLSRKVTQFRMQLFNRWGQLIFETQQTGGRGWDGRFNGKEQPAGVYIFLMDVEIGHSRPEHYQGNVTLIR